MESAAKQSDQYIEELKDELAKAHRVCLIAAFNNFICYGEHIFLTR